MAQWRKKPIIIHAFQWTGDRDQEEDPEWVLEAIEEGVVFFESDPHTILKYLCIKTLGGIMRATPGDYIIRGVQGEIYPCKPDIFLATYEPVITYSMTEKK